MADQEGGSKEDEISRVIFEFDPDSSSLFRYARVNVSVFQLAIVLETVRALVEKEMAVWLEEEVHPLHDEAE